MNIRNDFITINHYSRPGYSLRGVKKIVYHWTGVKGQAASIVRNYFEQRKNGKDSYGSTQFVVDDKEIVGIMPETEVSWNCGSTDEFPYTENKITWFGYDNPNYYTIGIEMVPKNDEGQYEAETYIQAAELGAILCDRYNLNPLDDVVRHGDVTTKPCPRWFMSHEEDWKGFKNLILHFYETPLGGAI